MSTNDTRKTLRDFFGENDFSPSGTEGTDSITFSNLEDKNGPDIDGGDDLAVTLDKNNNQHPLLNFDNVDLGNISILGDYLSYITQHFHMEYIRQKF